LSTLKDCEADLLLGYLWIVDFFNMKGGQECIIFAAQSKHFLLTKH